MCIHTSLSLSIYIYTLIHPLHYIHIYIYPAALDAWGGASRVLLQTETVKRGDADNPLS